MSLFIRTWRLVLGMSSRLVSVFERRNPDALLENEKEHLRKLIGQFNASLVSHAAMAERLAAQVKRDEVQLESLRGRINALLSAGEDEAASRHALQFKELSARLTEDRSQLQFAETSYQELLRTRNAAITEARDKIERVRRQIGDLKVKRALADLEEMASAMVSGFGGSGDSLNRLEELVEEERAKAAARISVAGSGPSLTGTRQSEAEQAAYAKAALEEFRQGGARAGQAVRALPDLSSETPLAEIFPPARTRTLS